MDRCFRMPMMGSMMQRDIWGGCGIGMHALLMEHPGERCHLRVGAQGSDWFWVPLSMGKKHWGRLLLCARGGVDN